MYVGILRDRKTSLHILFYIIYLCGKILYTYAFISTVYVIAPLIFWLVDFAPPDYFFERNSD